ncbi:MAG: universal stress protein [Candidatus Pedobacter colombiensis]|uniref:Universal stress protein n=1 Tax=Candidatus Pedobacter colombiensis TaxID=3121371 RepID=A0AAJ5W8D4_9SPHI|nr:universal stress protein [Pedobacter sp.]WEK18970.1 MAG: universal stress protein [Pedobacter sp.]
MKPLLLLTDFSESGNHAVEYGYHLAKHLKTNVMLCNAVDMAGAANMLWPAEAYDTLITESGKELKKLKKHLERTDHHTGFHPQISYQSKLGRLLDVVESIRQKEDFYMIVIGAHRTGFARFLLENHSKSMIDTLTCPLLIVPQDAALSDIKKIAFGTDFKNHKRDLEAIYKLIPMAEQMGAKILLAHIHKGEIADIKKMEDEFLTEISNKANYPHIFYSCVEHDKADEGLCQLCTNQQVDMLVMLHRSRDFFELMFGGSHTHKVAVKVTVPLMVIPE